MASGCPETGSSPREIVYVHAVFITRKESIQKEAAPTPSSRGSVSGCRGMCRHHASSSTNEHMPVHVAPKDRPCSHVSGHSPRQSRNFAICNAPSPRQKTTLWFAHDSLTRRREGRARCACQPTNKQLEVNNTADSTVGNAST
jgi:hypothetical protein